MDFERFSIVVSFETTRIEMNPVVQNFLDVWDVRRNRGIDFICNCNFFERDLRVLSRSKKRRWIGSYNRDQTELRILDDNSVRHLDLGIATSFQDTKHIPSTLIKGQSREEGRHESVRVEKTRIPAWGRGGGGKKERRKRRRNGALP